MVLAQTKNAVLLSTAAIGNNPAEGSPLKVRLLKANGKLKGSQFLN